MCILQLLLRGDLNGIDSEVTLVEGRRLLAALSYGFGFVSPHRYTSIPAGPGIRCLWSFQTPIDVDGAIERIDLNR